MAFGGTSPWGQGQMISGPGAALFGKQQAQARWNQNEQQRQATRQQAINAAGMSNGVPIGAAAAAASVDAANPTGARPAPMYAVTGPAKYRGPAPDRDISQPGDLEKAYAQHGQKFFDPTAAENFNAQHGAAFMAPDANQQLWQQQQAAGPMVNNSQGVFNGFQAPTIASEPGYGSYYDNAQNNTVNALNTQLGARGAYGSSVGLGQIGKSVTDLRADQARTEADYNLRRLTEQRGWESLRGDLARNADLSSQGNQESMSKLANNASTSRLEGMNSAADAAASADRMRLAGLTGGTTAAGMSQNAREGRVGMGLDSLIKNAGGLSSLLGEGYDKLIGDDKELIDSIFGGLLTRDREALNQSSQKNITNSLGNLFQTYKAIKGS